MEKSLDFKDCLRRPGVGQDEESGHLGHFDFRTAFFCSCGKRPAYAALVAGIGGNLIRTKITGLCADMSFKVQIDRAV